MPEDKRIYVVHPVSEETKKHLSGPGIRLVDAKFAPPGAEIVHHVNVTAEAVTENVAPEAIEAEKTPEIAPEPLESIIQREAKAAEQAEQEAELSFMREYITEATGKAPHHNLGPSKIKAQYETILNRESEDGSENEPTTD